MDYPLGTRFMSGGKHPRECTVIDVHKTYNHAGELVKTRYVASHKFLGQVVIDHDLPQATVARGLINE